MITRLSAPPMPASPPRDVVPPVPVVSDVGQALLRSGVEDAASKFTTLVNTSGAAAEELRAFLGSPAVADAPLWSALFGAQPPRGVVARIARRSGATLPGCCGYFNYKDKAAFLQEVARMRAWYSVGRKKTRRRRGIIRGESTPPRVKGRSTVWTSK
eukprot:16441872-Heterocapsa_arctica.AAC.1